MKWWPGMAGHDNTAVLGLTYVERREELDEERVPSPPPVPTCRLSDIRRDAPLQAPHPSLIRCLRILVRRRRLLPHLKPTLHRLAVQLCGTFTCEERHRQLQRDRSNGVRLAIRQESFGIGMAEQDKVVKPHQRLGMFHGPENDVCACRASPSCGRGEKLVAKRGSSSKGVPVSLLPAVRLSMGLGLVERLEAQAVERGALHVADARFDLALAIRIADATSKTLLMQA